MDDPRVEDFTKRIDEATFYYNMAVNQDNEPVRFVLRNSIANMNQQREDIINGRV